MGEAVDNNNNSQDVQIEISAPLDMASISVDSVVNQENVQTTPEVVNSVQQPVSDASANVNDVQIEIDPEVTFNLSPIINNISQTNNEQAVITSESPVVEQNVVVPEQVAVEQPVMPVEQVQNVPAAPVSDVAAPVEENIAPMEPTMNEVNQVIDLQPVAVPEVPEPVAPPNVEGINQITNSNTQLETEEELEDLSQPTNSDEVKESVPQEVDADEELVKIYVGDKYDDFKPGKFNLGFCLFGSAYLAYRRMGSHAFLLFILELVFIPVFPLIRIGGAFIVNGSYLKNARRNVKSIKEKNSSKTDEELKNIIEKKGKPSMMNLIIVAFLFLFLLIVLIAVLCITLLAPTLAKFNLVLYNM